MEIFLLKVKELIEIYKGNVAEVITVKDEKEDKGEVVKDWKNLG